MEEVIIKNKEYIIKVSDTHDNEEIMITIDNKYSNDFPVLIFTVEQAEQLVSAIQSIIHNIKEH